jgi:putative transposase
MPFNSEKHCRRSIRLPGYDYSQPGAYFVTICTQDRAYLFGEVVNGEMRLNKYGQIVDDAWNDLSNHYAGLILDAFVIMPNHVHGVIVLTGDPIWDGLVGAGLKPAPTHTKHVPLSEIVRAFKTFSARRINQCRGTPGAPVWQRNYYEHIIRNEESLNRIREYILQNPLRWHLDRENPERIGTDDLWDAIFSVGVGTRPAPNNRATTIVAPMGGNQ